MQIVGFHADNQGIYRSDGMHPKLSGSPSDILNYLIYPQNRLRICYHLDAFVASVTRLLGMDTVEAELLFQREEYTVTDYLLKYAAKKFFSVTQLSNKRFVTFYDASQYLKNGGKIMEARPSLMQYRQSLATIAQDTGQQVYDALVSIGLHPTSLASPITSYQHEVLDKLDLPTVDDAPEEAMEYAYNCCAAGGWVEAFKRGFFEHAWDYDVASAYPFFASHLVDLRQGHWYENSDVPEPTPFEMGYADCTVTITDPFSPVFLTITKGETQYDRHNYSPVGTWRRFLTLRTIRHIEYYKLGHVEVHNGWWWRINTTSNDVLNFPLREPLAMLYHHRELAEGLQKDVIKRCMTGTYGLQLQTKGNRFGHLFNPIYGAEIENNTKIYVHSWCVLHGITPLHVAVDGVVTDKEVDCGEKTPGHMYLAGQGKALIVGSGMAALEGKWNGHDFSINYDSLVEQIKSDPNAREYKQTKLAPVTIGRCIQDEKLWLKLGELAPMSKTIDIAYETKRFYPEAPETGGDLLTHQYDSLPWDSSMLQVEAQQ